ncbi:MAG: 60S ribosomal export protein NMD3 [Candidatus Micrarchaeota archaeon]|nr:60S ribosomal export protein NMD3 [Candidatus Micrarchaeota archaeon]
MPQQKNCPKCGKNSTDYNFINDFCLEHFLEELFRSLESKKIRIKKCRQCKKLKIISPNSKEFLWVEEKDQKFFLFLVSKIGLPKNLITQIEGLEKNILKIKIENKPYLIPLKIDFLETICENCKKNSKSFKSIIQIRGQKNNIQKFYSFLLNLLEKEKIRILKQEHLAEGPNIFVDEKQKLVFLFSLYKIKFLRTSKLVGQRRDGKRIYLDTFLIKV